MTTTTAATDEFFRSFQVVPPCPKSPERICQFVGLSSCDLPPMSERLRAKSAHVRLQLASVLSRPDHTNTHAHTLSCTHTKGDCQANYICAHNSISGLSISLLLVLANASAANVRLGWALTIACASSPGRFIDVAKSISQAAVKHV